MNVKVPQSVSLAELRKVLQQKHGGTRYFLAQGYAEGRPGDGCQCADCQKERGELINQIGEMIRAEHAKITEQNCPQRAARLLDKKENPPKKKKEQESEDRIVIDAYMSMMFPPMRFRGDTE